MTRGPRQPADQPAANDPRGYDPRGYVPRDTTPPWREASRPRPGRRRDSIRDGVEERRGIQVGPITITPVRVALAVALIGSLAYLAFALTVRETAQLPLLSSGAAVLGIAFMALAVSGFFGLREAGYEGRSGRAVGLAVLGGLSAIIAFGCFAAAIVLGLEA